jgi:hypothetical protein
MRVRRPWLALVVLLVPAGAHSGDHRFGVFIAPSYLRAKGSTDHLGGWHVSGEATLKKTKRRLSFIGDVSIHPFGSDGDKDLTQVTFITGTRWTFLAERKYSPSVHFMAIGAVLRTEGKLDVSTATGAIAVGLALDFVPAKEGPWGLRAQIDYVVPYASDLESSVRVSVGWMYRFHDHWTRPPKQPAPPER